MLGHKFEELSLDFSLCLPNPSVVTFLNGPHFYAIRQTMLRNVLQGMEHVFEMAHCCESFAF